MSILDHLQISLADAEGSQLRMSEVAWRGPRLCRLSVLDEMLEQARFENDQDRVLELTDKIYELEIELGLR